MKWLDQLTVQIMRYFLDDNEKVIFDKALGSKRAVNEYKHRTQFAYNEGSNVGFFVYDKDTIFVLDADDCQHRGASIRPRLNFCLEVLYEAKLKVQNKEHARLMALADQMEMTKMVSEHFKD